MATTGTSRKGRASNGRNEKEALKQADYEGQIGAIHKSLAVIEFEMDGTIITANENWLRVVGYNLEEIQGKHHKLFVLPTEKDSHEYKAFWDDLNQGRFVSGEFHRIGKQEKDIWVRASYNPILDSNGKPFKVVKYAIDETEEKLRNADYESQLEAINKSQAVIVFAMDGTIQHANENFLETMGYTLAEVKGRHHRMFVEPDTRDSEEYQAFWDRLRRGEFQSAEYKRIGKNGKEVWIQASYNPILDLHGVPYKVVKFASDVTERVNLRMEAERNHQKTSKLLEEVLESSNQFAESSQVIAESSAHLSDGAQTQAAAVEEMNAAIDELTQAIQVITERSSASREQANETTTLASDGGKAVKEAIHAMQLIEKSSEQITDIIQVISEIASQTNLLALNAAIEAARAGEHGLGFAVVADEVRKLAERSSEAAKEITLLIKESSRRVSEGAQMSGKVGHSLTEIVQAVESTATGIREIAEQTEAQAASAHQVHSAIRSVSDTTESQAASAEELAASAEELGAQAQSLKNLVSTFTG